jgi:hypothetical protein
VTVKAFVLVGVHEELHEPVALLSWSGEMSGPVNESYIKIKLEFMV